MLDFIDLRSIGKFDGTNFQVWKFQMKAILFAAELTDIVYGIEKREEATSQVAREAWDVSNARAMVIMSSTMEASQIDYLLTCETAADMWNRLTDIYEQNSESSKSLLMSRFYAYRMESGDKVALYVSKVENLARQLRDIGETISDVTIIRKILGSLPGKYNALVSAWDRVERGNQTLDNLRLRLINEEARMTARDEASDALAAMSLKVNKTQRRTREKKPQYSRTNSVECYYCHKLGHYAKNCRKKNRDTRDERRHEEEQRI